MVINDLAVWRFISGALNGSGRALPLRISGIDLFELCAAFFFPPGENATYVSYDNSNVGVMDNYVSLGFASQQLGLGIVVNVRRERTKGRTGTGERRRAGESEREEESDASYFTPTSRSSGSTGHVIDQQNSRRPPKI